MRVCHLFSAAVVAVCCVTAGCASADRITEPSTEASNSAGSPQDPGGAPPTTDSCDAEKARWAVGERATADVLERARKDAGAATARFIRPNEPITMEYLGSRLNLGLDDQDVVRSVNCG